MSWRLGCCRFCSGRTCSPTHLQRATSSYLRAAAPLVHERMALLSEAVDMLGFLFVDDAVFESDADAAAKKLNDGGRARLGGGGGVAGARSSTGARTTSRRRSRRRWSAGSGSSRAMRSRRCGSRSPGGRSRRRCSSRWSCSAGSAACRGSGGRPRRPAERRLRSAPERFGRVRRRPIHSTSDRGRPVRSDGVWGNWQPG